MFLTVIQNSPKRALRSAGTSAVHVSLSSDEIVKQQDRPIYNPNASAPSQISQTISPWLTEPAEPLRVQMETRQRPPQSPRRRRRWPLYKTSIPKRSRSFFKKTAKLGRPACGQFLKSAHFQYVTRKKLLDLDPRIHTPVMLSGTAISLRPVREAFRGRELG
jgi:hypothetical protein